MKDLFIEDFFETQTISLGKENVLQAQQKALFSKQMIGDHFLSAMIHVFSEFKKMVHQLQGVKFLVHPSPSDVECNNGHAKAGAKTVGNEMFA